MFTILFYTQKNTRMLLFPFTHTHTHNLSVSTYDYVVNPGKHKKTHKHLNTYNYDLTYNLDYKYDIQCVHKTNPKPPSYITTTTKHTKPTNIHLNKYIFTGDSNYGGVFAFIIDPLKFSHLARIPIHTKNKQREANNRCYNWAQSVTIATGRSSCKIPSI